jgi:cytochrome c oxidase subunit 3
MVETPVTEPYSDPRQQHDAAMMGMYIFLGNEVMLFGGIFAVALYARLVHTKEAVAASKALHYGIGGTNTAILLTSSLCIALAAEAGRQGERKPAIRWLIGAILLGLGFLGLKGYEYLVEFREGLMPFRDVDTAIRTPVQHMFMDLYLIATSLHALHMLIGVGLVAYAVVGLSKRWIAVPERAITLIVIGLYWHFVDVVWVFLYPVLYLAR